MSDVDGNTQAEPIELFPFLRLVSVALSRGHLSRQQAAVAYLIAPNSDGITGESVTVDVDTTAIEMDISPRQVWRHFQSLVDNGWFEQTHKPTRGQAGRPGRRARYRLTLPRLNLSPDLAIPEPYSSDTDTAENVTRNSESNANSEREGVTRNRVTSTSAGMSRASVKLQESCDSSTPNRVTVLNESCDIAERENGTVLPSDGSTSDGTTTRTQVRNRSPDRARAHPSPPLLAKGA